MLPVVTTTGSILRPADGDPYETGATDVVASGLAAHLSSPSGNEVDRGGQLERIDTILLTEPGADLTHTDLWRDDTTEQTYRVGWVERRVGLGLDHTKAGLARFDGGASG